MYQLCVNTESGIFNYLEKILYSVCVGEQMFLQQFWEDKEWGKLKYFDKNVQRLRGERFNVFVAIVNDTERAKQKYLEKNNMQSWWQKCKEYLAIVE